MIDTVRFRLSVSEHFLRAIQKKSITTQKVDNDLQTELYCIHTTHLHLGSYDYHVNLFSNEGQKRLVIEFSAPKYLYGHNLYTIDLARLKSLTHFLHRYLLVNFGDLVEPESWEIQRLDLCYAWKFDEQRTAEAFLRAMQTVNYERLRRELYDTGVVWKGETLSMKFYLKLPEFFKHDYVRLKKINEDRANELLSYASGVLRFEITLRKKALQRIFEVEKLRLRHLSPELMLTVLSGYFSQLLKYVSEESMTLEQIQKRLLEKHSKKLARNIYLYYLALQLTDPAALVLYKAMADRSTVYRYDTYLKDLKIPKVAIKSGYAFTIPSIYAVSDGGKGGSPSPFAPIVP